MSLPAQLPSLPEVMEGPMTPSNESPGPRPYNGKQAIYKSYSASNTCLISFEKLQAFNKCSKFESAHLLSVI